MTFKCIASAAAIILLSACQAPPPPAVGAVAPASGLSAVQIAALVEQGFVETGDGWMFDIASRILFRSDSSDLNPDQGLVLERIAHALCAVEIRWARVEGHTDNTGSAGHNRRLSLARARAVSDALARGGMARDLIRVEGLGHTRPIESNRTASGRAENRRVAIVVPASTAGQGPCPAA